MLIFASFTAALVRVDSTVLVCSISLVSNSNVLEIWKAFICFKRLNWTAKLHLGGVGVVWIMIIINKILHITDS